MDSPPHVAITGAAGYVGKYLVSTLQQTEPTWRLTAVDDFSRGDARTIGSVSVSQADVRDREAMRQRLGDADVICHLAAVSGVDDCADQPDRAFDVNVTGANTIARICRTTGAALLFPFSMAVVGESAEGPITAASPRNPSNWYGRTKYMGEKAIEILSDGEFQALSFMISNVYGQYDVCDRVVSKPTVVNFFIKRAVSGEPLTVYEPGTQARNFIHVRDVGQAFVDGCRHALDTDATGATTYELATQDVYSVREVAELVASVAEAKLGSCPPVETVPNPRDEALRTDFDVETSRLRNEIGWQPAHSLEQSIEGAIEGAKRTMTAV